MRLSWNRRPHSPGPDRSPPPRRPRANPPLGRWTPSLEGLESRVLLSASLVKDIFPDGSASPSALVNVNGTVFFVAGEDTHGDELWKSDGTAGRTQMVKDIRPGTSGSVPSYLTNLNGTLFFAADDGQDNQQLWRSDGTAAGTQMVAQIGPAAGALPTQLTNVNGTLFFVAVDPATNGTELFKSNGNPGGTSLIKDINPNGNAISTIQTSTLTNVNGTLFFAADDGVHGFELWESDGTAAGTQMVKDVAPGTNLGSYPRSLTNVNGICYFAANGAGGRELWRSDGTAFGTFRVADINTSGSPHSFPQYLTNVNGSLFFEADDGVHGFELWESDGTAAGTQMVKDLTPGTGNNSYPFGLRNVNGSLFFQVNIPGAPPGITGVYRSDGTAAGTTLLKNVGSDLNNPVGPQNVNGTYYFGGDDGTHGAELWRSDGTAAGTVLVQDISPGAGTSYPAQLTNVGGTLFFTADDSTHGDELWKLPDAVANASLSAVTVGSTNYVFAIKPGNNLFYYNGSSWAFVGPGGLYTTVAAVAEGNGNVAAFLLGTNHALYRFNTSQGGTPAQIASPNTVQAFSVGNEASGQADVFVIGGDGTFLEYKTSTGWQPAIGGRNSVLQMSAVKNNQVVVVGSDRSVFSHDDTNGWVRLSGSNFARAVSAVTDGHNRLVVYAQTPDLGMQRYEQATGWAPVGGAGTIAAISAGIDASDGLATAFILSPAGVLAEYDTLAGWQALSPPGVPLKVSATVSDRVFMAMADGSVWWHDDLAGFAKLANAGFLPP